MTTPINQRWSHIYNAWIEPSSWNDREEIARLNNDINTLRNRAAPATPAGDEIIDAQHEETGRMWRGTRSQLPQRFHKVTIYPAATDGDDAELWQRLIDASHDERLSTGMLYRQAAARIAELERQLAAPVGDDASKWAKWRADLTALGGFDNELVAVPAGPVRDMIVLGASQAARIAELERERDELRAELDAMQRDSLRKAAINVALLSKLAAERERRE